MDYTNTDRLLIEYILTLLKFSETHHIDLEHLMENDWQTAFSILSDSQDLHTAYSLIRFMDEMPGGFFIYHADQEEQIVYANKAVLRIFQCDNMKEFQALTGNSFRGIVFSEDLDGVEHSIKEQIAASKYDLDYVEYRILCKDGSIRWIEDYGHFIHSETAGDFFYVFIGDATEKRNRQLTESATLINEKEQELQEIIDEYNKERNLIDQEQLRRLKVIEGLSVNYDSILYIDLDTNNVLPYRLSDRTQKQFNQKLRSLDFPAFTSEYINTWVHPEDRALLFEVTAPNYIRSKLSVSKTYYTNYRVINNHAVQYLQLRIVNVGSNEHISQIVMGYRIVDEEIQREMEQNQLLENALENANLAMDVKNTFLANMSHDMRTPLNAIFGFTSLARKNIADKSTALSYLDKIESSSRQLLDLIDKVLKIAWLESNNAGIAESKCSLQDITCDVYNTLFPHASGKSIDFSLHTDELLHSDIYGDSDKLTQLLHYITNNAITYTEPGGKVDMYIKELDILTNNCAVYQFKIQDTGIGISENFLAHIYEPFERENNTTLSGAFGTGLGLTITKHIVDMMGGSIEIDSALHKGTTFTVTLTLRMQDSAPAMSENAQSPYSRLAGLKILIVEDNEINLEIETELLRDQGFLVDTAENGSIAIEKMKNARPEDYSLILMDIQMPVMNGLKAAKAIRALEDPELANIPIIALSANAFESDKRASLESGMNVHLTKPIDIPLLLETMSKLIHTKNNI